MAQANQAMAIKRFVAEHDIDLGLKSCYDISVVLRTHDLWDLLHPDLQTAIKEGFKKDREDEIGE